MSRKNEPALYELISQKQTHSLTKMAEGEDPEFEDVDLEHNLITPGRSVRMPLGTIGVFVAVGIAMIMISYMLGFRKGSAIAREDYANRLYEQHSSPTLSEVKPSEVVVSQPKIPILTPDIEQLPKQAPTPTTSESTVSTRIAPMNGGIMSDPRVSGMWYFTLMQTTSAGATKLAIFCRARGLETYVISSDNTDLYRVIALPGSMERYDAKMAETESKIHAIGRVWAETTDGRGSDLQDAYRSIK